MKKFWERLKNPNWVQFVISLTVLIASSVGVALFIIYVGMGTQYDVAAYVLFIVSGAAFAYTVYYIVKRIMRAKPSIIAFLSKFTFTRNMIEKYGFRTIIFTAVGFTIGMAYALVNGISGIIQKSFWHIALGVYYLSLSLIRGSILLFHRRKYKSQKPELKIKKGEAITYAVCGGGLTLLPMALGAVIWEMVAENTAFSQYGMLIYLSAAYTFYKIVASVCNLVKAKKSDDMTVRAVRNINLAETLVSMLALQTAMFQQFAPEQEFGWANALVGTIVCAATACIGIIMIVKGLLKLSKTKKDGIEENAG